MERRNLIVGLLFISLVFAGCQSMGSDAKMGTGIGAVAGSVLGGVVGHQTGFGVEGALIGGALGAGAGALIGSGMDDKNKAKEQQAVTANPSHVSILKVVELSSKGTPDDVIIDEMRSTNSVYDIDANAVQYLKDNKVSDKVINYMVSTKK